MVKVQGMSLILDKIYNRVTKALPPEVAGRVDLLRPSYRDSWGGPLNGQARRREVVRDLAVAIQFDRVIETGTYRGTSTEFFAAVFGMPVETVEANPRFFAYCSRRLRQQTEVSVNFGDSRAFLKRLATVHADETTFIYLDAHWEQDLPLAEELGIVASGWPRAVVMIDDFQVSGDPGYGYDDYGPGMALVEEYLPSEGLRGWSVFYPTASSDLETGAKRGSVVLSSPLLTGDVRTVGRLRAGRSL
jgi:predicted O-methyltransferase YrrM